MKEYDNIYFETSSFDEAMIHYADEKKHDVWTVLDKGNIRALALPNCPIMAETMEMDTDGESVKNGMDQTQMAISFNEEGRETKLPLADTALLPILSLYGLDCKKMLSTNTDPDKREQTFNLFAEEEKGGCKILHRNGMVRYVGGQNYSPLPVVDLLETLETGLMDKFPLHKFTECWESNELSEARWILSDPVISQKIKSLNIKELDDYEASLVFVTSDVGLHAASLYAYLQRGNNVIPIGTSVGINHVLPNTTGDMLKQTDKIFSLFDESIDRMLSLSDIEIKHPLGCFINMAKAYLKSYIKKQTILDVGDMLEGKYQVATALDIYMELNSCVSRDENERGKSFDMMARLSINEALARALKADFSKLDHVADF